MFDSVRMRLTLWYVGVLTVVLVAFSFGVYSLLARKLGGRLDAALQTAGEGAARLLSHERDERESDAEAARSAFDELYLPHQAVAVFDRNGRLLAERALPGDIHVSLPTNGLTQTAATQFLTLPHARGAGDDGLRVVMLRLYLPQDNSTFLIVVGQPLADLAEELELLRKIFYAAIPAALALAGLGGWFLAHKSLQPVATMADAARRISAEKLAERLPVANKRDELGQLATTFNDLLGRLDAAFIQQREFMADASHELRTPLCVARTTGEVTLDRAHRDEAEYREAVALMVEQMRRLSHIVEDMFTLARADAGHGKLQPTDFYLDELLAETARAAQVIAGRKGVRVACLPAPETAFSGDEDLLRQMLLNLLDNAIRHTSEGGEITLQLKPEADRLCVTITDTGTGIPVAAQPHVFERFYRADKARSRPDNSSGSGAGLGLPIARRVAEAHGGTLRLIRSDVTGTVFQIDLPR